MTLPVDEEKCAGKERLEHGRLERDELLTDCVNLSGDDSTAALFSSFSPRQHLLLRMHVP